MLKASAEHQCAQHDGGVRARVNQALTSAFRVSRLFCPDSVSMQTWHLESEVTAAARFRMCHRHFLDDHSWQSATILSHQSAYKGDPMFVVVHAGCSS